MKSCINSLKIKNLGIDTRNEHAVFVHALNPIVKSEGFEAITRVLVKKENKSVVATLTTLYSNLLSNDEASLSVNASDLLDIREGDEIILEHLPPISSFSAVRGKMYGKKFKKKDFQQILTDIKEGIYSDVHTSSFITACAGDALDIEEIVWLTENMVSIGEQINWKKKLVVDKHCVGGLPGNRTTPIVVSIVASAGLSIPKTSSRAITSPAGTADTMETITKVDLSIEQIKKVVHQEDGCFVWGGAVKLSPVDDMIIRVEHSLDIDSEGQMIASVLSKKKASGSNFVVIDIPVGPTAKVRSKIEALKLKYYFTVVGMAIGIRTKVIISDGRQPVGYGIGPALEAVDVLKVLRNEEDAPEDLIEHSVNLAGQLLEFGKKAQQGQGIEMAREIIKSGKAYDKFQKICQAQGDLFEPPVAKFQTNVLSDKAGVVKSIDCRKIAKVAKLAGAPSDKAAGIYCLHKLGDRVKKGDILYTIHAESKGALNYALEYTESEKQILLIQAK